jgi:hypothetical protein
MGPRAAPGVELWDLASVGSPERLDSVHVGSPVRALAVGEDGVGVGTDAGFLRVAPVAGSCGALEPLLDACGAVRDVVPIGRGRWLLGTTAGAAMVGRDASGALALTSAMFVEAGPKGFSLQPIDGSAASLGKCKKLDRIGCGPQCSGIGDRRLSFDGRHAELARGSSLLRLAVTPEGELALVDGIPLAGTIRGVRSTAESAYVVSGDGKGKPVRVALGAAMTPAGSHEVGDWVFGEQSGRFRARLRPAGRVEVAWVER